MVKASVIIVNWNGRAHLPVCLDSIKAQTFRDFEVIFVDNGSSDGSLEFVTSEYPWVKTVALPVNQGFSGGNNEGWRHASGEYIITLNNDTETHPGWIEELARTADENPQAGMVASRVCSFDDHDVIDSLGVKICSDGMSRGAFRLRRFSDLALGKTEKILLPSACAALYRRRMIEEIGFFDDDFFAYCEDTDLGLRGRRAGWDALLARDAVVYHKYSHTSGTFSPFKLYLVERNHYWLAIKNFPLSWLAFLPAATFLRYAQQAGLVLSGKGIGPAFLSSGEKKECMKALLKGIFDALAKAHRFWCKRAFFSSRTRLDAREEKQLLNTYKMSFRELFDAG